MKTEMITTFVRASRIKLNQNLSSSLRVKIYGRTGSPLYAVRLYRISQQEMSIVWEVTVSVILSKKKVYMYMWPIPNGFRDKAISLYRRATRHVLTRVTKCIDVAGGIEQKIPVLETVLNNSFLL
jgi:hypothetical protein